MRRMLSYGLAVFLGIVCAFELLMLLVHALRGTLGEARFVGRLLSQPELADRAVPIAVILVFAWILLQVVGRTTGVARERSAVAGLRAGGSVRIAGHLRAGRRARLLGKYASAPGKLAEALPAVGGIDAAALDNGYALLRAYVWSLPVLGFIGTAWGMAHAISGFSEALTVSGGNGQPQIELLTDRLAQLVIPGLANAFSITMLALGASVIAHFWVTTVQSWDQEVLDELDRVSIDKLAEATPATPQGGLPGHLVAALVERIGALTEELQGLRGKLDLVDVGERLQQAASAHTAAAQALGAAAGEIKSSTSLPYHITIQREATDGR